MTKLAPQGHFFRVKESITLAGSFRVELRMLRPYFGSRIVESATVFVPDFDSAADAIEAAEEELCERYLTSVRTAEIITDARKMIGDRP